MTTSGLFKKSVLIDAYIGIQLLCTSLHRWRERSQPNVPPGMGWLPSVAHPLFGVAIPCIGMCPFL